MVDLNDKIDSVVDGVVAVLIWIIIVAIFLIVMITAPVWLVPYLVYRTFKQKKEDRENDGE